MSMSDVNDAEEKLETVLSDVKSWMDGKQLKLNPNKTEVLIVGKKMSLRRLGTRSLRILDSTLDGRSAVKDLGVLLDENLSFEAQINKVVKVAGYHLRNIGFVRKHLDEDTVKMLLHDYVTSRLDYCNSLYFGLPKYRLRKIQYVMNRAVRLLRGLAPRERVTAVLMELLHWLPIKARIVFKIFKSSDFSSLEIWKTRISKESSQRFSSGYYYGASA
ncbi:uncharacterized protein LOC143030329 [Oratosquilla oratoria]|uniref:uncharacterized protein LOC143030329 n=1 Tax=Oratosquilla oratoria TaxID=337810 RepID=UPI003F7661B4